MSPSRSLLLASSALLLASTLLAAKPAAPSAKNSQVERGKYLVTIIGCDDCHTPWMMGPKGPEPDMTRRLSGHPEGQTLPPPPDPKGPWIVSLSGDHTAQAGPWGITYTANLTPDKNTGLGIWTEEMFIKALRTGKHMGTSRSIQPLMPWFNFAKMTDSDLKAVFAYLRTLKPIVNHVPDPVIAPPPPAPAK